MINIIFIILFCWSSCAERATTPQHGPRSPWQRPLRDDSRTPWTCRQPADQGPEPVFAFHLLIVIDITVVIVRWSDVIGVGTRCCLRVHGQSPVHGWSDDGRNLRQIGTRRWYMILSYYHTPFIWIIWIFFCLWIFPQISKEQPEAVSTGFHLGCIYLSKIPFNLTGRLTWKIRFKTRVHSLALFIKVH